MDVIFSHCAGLDVHKKRITACRVTPNPIGHQADGLLELQDFGPMTADLLALSDWLAAAGVTHVAMESTGEYWKLVYNILEGNFTVFLANAAHVKQVPGRKTDKADARWLAMLMRYGLLQVNFIPPQRQRDLRDLTRYRTQLVQARDREVKRVHGVLERANIELAAGARNIFGVSGRAILTTLIEGRADPAAMAELAKGRLRSKTPILEQALTGLVPDYHRRWLTNRLAHLDFLDEQIDALSDEITRILTDLSGGEPHATLSDASQPAAPSPTVPGVDQRGEAASTKFMELPQVVLLQAQQNAWLAFRHVAYGLVVFILVWFLDSQPVLSWIHLFAEKGLANPDLSWVRPAKWFMVAGASAFTGIAYVLNLISLLHIREARLLAKRFEVYRG